MPDDEKMFNIGVGLIFGVVCLTALLQVCYREQNRDIKYVRNAIENTEHDLEIAQTRFSSLSSADSLRNSVVMMNPKAETVSFNKTIHIDEIQMVQE